MKKHSSNVTISLAALLQSLAISDEGCPRESLASNALQHCADDLEVLAAATPTTKRRASARSGRGASHQHAGSWRAEDHRRPS